MVKIEVCPMCGKKVAGGLTDKGSMFHNDCYWKLEDERVYEELENE